MQLIIQQAALHSKNGHWRTLPEAGSSDDPTDCLQRPIDLLKEQSRYHQWHVMQDPSLPILSKYSEMSLLSLS